MPIYDYVCSTCSTRTEFIHGIDADAPRFCPACGAEGTLRKAFVAPSVHFKGSGWAKKDRTSSSSSKTKAAAAESSDGAGSTGDGASADKASGGGDAKGVESAGGSGSKKASDAGASKGAAASTSSEG